MSKASLSHPFPVLCCAVPPDRRGRCSAPLYQITYTPVSAAMHAAAPTLSRDPDPPLPLVRPPSPSSSPPHHTYARTLRRAAAGRLVAYITRTDPTHARPFRAVTRLIRYICVVSTSLCLCLSLAGRRRELSEFARGARSFWRRPRAVRKKTRPKARTGDARIAFFWEFQRCRLRSDSVLRAYAVRASDVTIFVAFRLRTPDAREP